MNTLVLFVLCLFVQVSFAALLRSPLHVHKKPRVVGRRTETAGKRTEIDDYYDSTYTVNVSIGTPPQFFVLKLDTSFSQLVVEQLDCAVDPPVNPYVPTLPPVDKRQFDPNESSTLSQYGDYCSLDPWGGGDGSNRFDVVQLNDLVVQQGAFCLLDVTSYELHHALYDGILGLGFQDGDEDYAIMKELVEQFDRPLFTIWLDDRKQNRLAGSAGGLLSFGDLDADHCDSDWTFVPLSPVDWDVDYGPQWKVNMTTVEIGRYTVDIERQATVFSGDSYLTAAATDFHAIMAELGAQFDYRVDEFVLECSRRDQLPDLMLTIGGREFSISAHEYLFESDAGDGLCNVAITGSIEDENPNTWSLGEPFMRAHCVAFDYGRSQLGFAKALKQN